jgi:hypothetical protein
MDKKIKIKEGFNHLFWFESEAHYDRYDVDEDLPPLECYLCGRGVDLTYEYIIYELKKAKMLSNEHRNLCCSCHRLLKHPEGITFMQWDHFPTIQIAHEDVSDYIPPYKWEYVNALHLARLVDKLDEQNRKVMLDKCREFGINISKKFLKSFYE